MRRFLPLFLLAGALALPGCGGEPSNDERGDVVATAGTAAGPGEAMADDDALPPLPALSAAHLDRLVRGIHAENEQLERAIQRLRDAESDRETLDALSGIDAETLDGHGAEAAGLAAHEYRFLRDALYEHLGAVDTRDALHAQYADADTTGLDEASAAEARRMAEVVMAAVPDPYADLDPALADALRQRHAELAALRSTHIGLLFKAAEG